MKKILFCLLFLSWASVATASAIANSGNSDRAMEFYKKLDKNNLDLVEKFYDKDVDFQDPVHSIHGFLGIKNYYAKLYHDVKSIHFEFSHSVSESNTTVLVWKMFLTTQALNGGREFSVDGTSVITFGGLENKAIIHRDYFDMGQFIYERIPILKNVILFIKNKLES